MILKKVRGSMRAMSQISMDNFFTTVKPKLTKREEWVLEAIEEIAPCSSEMVANRLGVGVNVVSGRFTGLKKKRKIIKDHEGTNEFGNKVAYYKPVSEPQGYDI
jgi:hypothetical protein